MEPTLGTATDIRTAWLGSAHADLTSEPFAHWNDESPAVVPKNCAKCHSGLGYQDFLGVLANPLTDPPESAPTSNLEDPAPSDGQGQLASGPWPVGTTVNCDACHNEVTAHLTAVTFPSGLTVTGLGDESRCIVCHQGRESTVSVEKKISDAYTAAKITTDDTVSTAVNFINVHYFAAAGSLYGREAETAYEYADPTKAALPVDPVTGLKPRKAYDRKFAHVASKDVCFECHDQHSLKVRVIVDEGETSAMRFDSQSLRAAFNYQYVQKEPGAWAHNNKYIVQILYDSIDDLDGDLTGLVRP